ncbi:hypothetical protein OAP83_02940, partial [Rickettsiales bacterium]|nr:hypothetical protein [Rickettsiales bacterium]
MRGPGPIIEEVNPVDQQITKPFRKFCNKFLSKFTLPEDIASTIQELNGRRLFFTALKTKFDRPSYQGDFSEEEVQFLVRSSQIDPEQYRTSDQAITIPGHFEIWLQETRGQISKEHLAYAEMEIESRIIWDNPALKSISIETPKDLDLARLYQAPGECSQHLDIGQVIIAKYLTENIFDQIRTNITIAWFNSLNEAHQNQILQIAASHKLMEQARTQKTTLGSLKAPINGLKLTESYEEDLEGLTIVALKKLPEASDATMDSLRTVIEEWKQREISQFQTLERLKSKVSDLEERQESLTLILSEVLSELEQGQALIKPEIYQALEDEFTKTQTSAREGLKKLLTIKTQQLHQESPPPKVKLGLIQKCKNWNQEEKSIDYIKSELEASEPDELIQELIQGISDLKTNKIQSIKDEITKQDSHLHQKLGISLQERINSWSESQSSEGESQHFLDQQAGQLFEQVDLRVEALSRLQKDIFSYPTPLMWLEDQIEPSLAASLKSKKGLKDDQRSKDFRKELSETVSTLEFTSIFPALTDVNPVVFEALFSLYNEFIRLETKSKLNNGTKPGDLNKEKILTEAETKLFQIIEAKQVLSISGKGKQPTAIFKNLVNKSAFTGSLALTIATSKLRDIPSEATTILEPNQEKLKAAIQKTNETIDQYQLAKASKESDLEKIIKDFAAPTMVVLLPKKISGSEDLEAKAEEQSAKKRLPLPTNMLAGIREFGGKSEEKAEKSASSPQGQKKSEVEQLGPT